MSYDVSIGGESFNYTYNLADFFHEHIPGVDGEDSGIRYLHGKTGRQATEILNAAFDRIQDERYRNGSGHSGEARFLDKYNPPNGWGSTLGAILFLSRVLAACALNPRSKVHVS